MSVVCGTKNRYDIEFQNIVTHKRSLLLLVSGVLAWTFGSSPNERLVCFQVAAKCFRFEAEMFLRNNFVLCLCREAGVQHKRTWRIIKMYNLRLYVIHFSRAVSRTVLPDGRADFGKAWKLAANATNIRLRVPSFRLPVVLELEFRHLATALGDGACAQLTASRIYLPLYSQRGQRKIISVAVAMYSLSGFPSFQIKQLSSRPGLHLPIPQPVPNANLSISIRNLARIPTRAGKHKQLSFFAQHYQRVCEIASNTTARNLELEIVSEFPDVWVPVLSQVPSIARWHDNSCSVRKCGWERRKNNTQLDVYYIELEAENKNKSHPEKCSESRELLAWCFTSANYFM